MRWAMVAVGTRNPPRDLLGGEAAHRAQGERDLRRQGQRRVAAQEQQLERVVGAGDLALTDLVQILTSAPRRVTAPAVDEAAVADPYQPGCRVVGHALARPVA